MNNQKKSVTVHSGDLKKNIRNYRKYFDDMVKIVIGREKQPESLLIWKCIQISG